MFDKIFNNSYIYDIMFVDHIMVRSFKTLHELEKNNKKQHDNWIRISNKLYKNEDPDKTYEIYANEYHEFSTICDISFGYFESQEKRVIKNVKGSNEKELITNFFELLNQLKNKKTLCSYDLTDNLIPNLIKKTLFYNNIDEENKIELPSTIREYLNSKPWDNNSVDISNLWKFKSYRGNSNKIIFDFLNYKSSVDIPEESDISHLYHSGDIDNIKEIKIISKNRVNFYMKLLFELRMI